VCFLITLTFGGWFSVWDGCLLPAKQERNGVFITPTFILQSGTVEKISEHIDSELATQVKQVVSVTESKEQQPGQSREEFLVSLGMRLRSPRTGVDIKNRKYRFRTYKQCFLGSEAVRWFLQQGVCTQ